VFDDLRDSQSPNRGGILVERFDLDLKTRVGRGDIVAQTEQVLANVRAALEAGGARPEHIIKWNLYVVEGQPLQAGFAAF
jgi:enamine deaminase RidA (YjgF/YER057c/UK114 family)